VKLLALAPGHRLHREQIVDALWADLAPEAGGANFRKALHFARRAMGSEDALVMEGDLLSLWPDADVSIDLDVFQAAARDALGSDSPEVCGAAADLATLELLPGDRYEPWAESVRNRVRRIHVQLLKRAERWSDVVEIDPLDEEAHRELMREAVDSGDRLDAIRRFEQLRSLLADELGVGPEPDTVAVYEQVLAMEGHEPVTLEQRARTLLDRALVALNRGDLDQADSEAREARALAMEGRRGRELGEATGLLGMIAHQRGNWLQLFEEEFVEVLRERPELAGFVFDAHLCLAEFSLYGAGGHQGVAAFAQGLLERVDRLQSLHGRALATLVLGETELLSGQLDAAEDSLSLSEQLHREAGADSGRVLAVQRLAEVDMARGHNDRAEASLRGVVGIAEGAPLASHLEVRVYGGLIACCRSSEEGRRVLQETDEELHSRTPCEPCSMGFLVSAAKAAARCGELAAARGYLDRAERIAGMWRGGAWQASAWEARATLREAEGDPSKAAALFAEAADLYAAVGHPLAEARCRAEAAAT
jgi:DNA-binding SARP family transcriptional activator